ncbi:hypothetical protein BASA60_004364 [Batrachochytrium salamandrivorans]|nr:hypothetical protein BASA62_009470 [Batrachochytrium salamandrivorans]KAH6576730.1 hypothetical protein BASA60_004364 [Batrachochytrium salamandrivorans]KAH9273503.1 hypothetical protein BASA83_004169 [Batrachochytrium salamandrivorans]
MIGQEDYEFDPDAMDYEMDHSQAEGAAGGSRLQYSYRSATGVFTDEILGGGCMRSNPEDIIVDSNFFNDFPDTFDDRDFTL